MVELTTELMEELYYQDKVLIEDVLWSQDRPGGPRFSTKARVQTLESEELLTFHGEFWNGKYSFVLRYYNTVIRCWDFNNHHDDIDGGHKHKYPYSDYSDDDPYNVDHIPTSDVNVAVDEFLEECSISADNVVIDEITGLSDYE